MWCYIPEDSTLHNHGFENLTYYLVLIYVEDETVFIQAEPAYCAD
jgi:hypothetical protein